MSASIEKTIDIEKILKSKMGSKAKYVPGFLVSWLKKIIHEDEVNKFLWESRGLSGTEWLTECVRYLKMDVEIVGLENLPDKNDGKLYTFVSNHPLGGQDGVCLGCIIGKHYDGKFRYLVNDLLLNLPGLKPVSIGINKTGRQSRDFPRMVEAGFQSDNHMLMFPAGLNSRKQPDGSIRDLPWKKTFISKSVEYQRDVVLYPLWWVQLRAILSHRPLQRQASAVQSRHAFPGRRDVQERGQAFPHRHRQTYSLADLRP